MPALRVPDIRHRAQWRHLVGRRVETRDIDRAVRVCALLQAGHHANADAG